MLTELTLKSFKCFKELQLPLAPLTVLSGTNGGGKSSVIQALVLMAESVSTREWSRSLLLDGPVLPLGSAADVLNQQSASRALEIGASTESQCVLWAFKADKRRALSVNLSQLMVDGVSVPVDGPLRWLMPADFDDPKPVVDSLKGMNWISAERTGPRELLPLRDPDSHRRAGARGELAAGMVYWHFDSSILPGLCIAGVPPTLFNQVRARMQQFFPGFDFQVSAVDGASAVSLQMRMDSRSDFQRPQNVGFGLTQLFPIVVSVLTATPTDTLLIENPEVHLHPRAQQLVGLLLADAAASGVQVLVETHSDHVLNGIRLATKKRQIGHEEVAVHFFSPNPDSGEIARKSPSIDRDGRLSEWPIGFFDQFDRALSELL